MEEIDLLIPDVKCTAITAEIEYEGKTEPLELEEIVGDDGYCFLGSKIPVPPRQLSRHYTWMCERDHPERITTLYTEGVSYKDELHLSRYPNLDTLVLIERTNIQYGHVLKIIGKVRLLVLRQDWEPRVLEDIEYEKVKTVWEGVRCVPKVDHFVMKWPIWRDFWELPEVRCMTKLTLLHHIHRLKGDVHQFVFDLLTELRYLKLRVSRQKEIDLVLDNDLSRIKTLKIEVLLSYRDGVEYIINLSRVTSLEVLCVRSGRPCKFDIVNAPPSLKVIKGDCQYIEKLPPSVSTIVVQKIPSHWINRAMQPWVGSLIYYSPNLKTVEIAYCKDEERYTEVPSKGLYVIRLHIERVNDSETSEDE
jgi:hypothetical protein